MGLPVSLGYRVPSSERITGRPWTFTVNGRQMPADAAQVEDWDYFASMSAERELQFDMAGLHGDCGFGEGTGLGAVVVWHSSWTNLRGSTEPVRIKDGPVTLKVDIDSGSVGGVLSLETLIVLLNPGPMQQPLSARRSGSRLWSDVTRLALEGSGMRFPILPADFPRQGFAEGRAAAGWYLECSTTDPTASGVGSLCLWLNTANPAMVGLLAEPDQHQLLGGQLNYDVARQLVQFALSNDELVDGAQHDPGTLGDLLINLLARIFGRVPLETLRGRWLENPRELETELQARLDFLGGT